MVRLATGLVRVTLDTRRGQEPHLVVGEEEELEAGREVQVARQVVDHCGVEIGVKVVLLVSII